MLGLLGADFPAWNLAALIGTDVNDAEQLLKQFVDAVLVDIAGVDATGLIRYRLHDLLRDFARDIRGRQAVVPPLFRALDASAWRRRLPRALCFPA